MQDEVYTSVASVVLMWMYGDMMIQFMPKMLKRAHTTNIIQKNLPTLWF